MRVSQMASWRTRIGWAFGYGFVLGLHGALFNLEEPTGILAFLSRLTSLMVWIYQLLLAGGIGTMLLARFLASKETKNIQRLVLSTSIGLGVVATLLSFLGFLQLFSPTAIQVLVFILLVFSAHHSREYAYLFKDELSNLFRGFRTSSPGTLLLVILTILLGSVTLINTLTPPWDYDGLMYHLLGPRQFLDAGGLFPNLENWYVNGPFSIEMLFTLGLSLQDDVIPKLQHFTFWIILCAALYSWAKDWVNGDVARLTLALMLGIPALPIWASFAYIDLAWSAFEFLALACLFNWRKTNENGWLILTGTFVGLAMSSKYLGLFGALITGVLFVFIVIHEERTRKIHAYLAITLPIVLIASPWYLKNLLWFHNPVYPLIWGGPAWDTMRLSLYNAYLESFGLGRGLTDFLRLPWDVYAHNESFGAVMNRNDIPNVLFLLAPFALLWRKDTILRIIGFVCLMRVGLWFLGSQQLRFLLPIYPWLSLLSAISIVHLSGLIKRPGSLRLFLPLLSISLIIIPIFYQIQVLRQFRTFEAMTGLLSEDEFLESSVGDYAASRFIRQQLPADARVLMLGNGRGYYCSPKCVPDPDHFHRARQLVELADGATISSWLVGESMTHILISFEDLDFLLQHDPTEIMHAATRRLSAIPSDACLERVYEDKWTQIYSVVCGGP